MIGYISSTSCSVVEGGGVVVVGSGVVRIQDGGVQEEREKSPVLPNTWTWTCNMFLLDSQFSHPGNEGVLLAAGNLVATQLKLHDLVERGERPGEGLHVRALVVDDVVVVKLKVVQAGRPVEVLEPGGQREPFIIFSETRTGSLPLDEDIVRNRLGGWRWARWHLANLLEQRGPAME